MEPIPSRWPVRAGLCLLAGLLTALAFPNALQKTLHPPFAFLAWFSLVPFFHALRGASPALAARLGYLFGFAHLGAILYWIALLEEAQYLSLPAWTILVGYLSVYFAAFGWLLNWSKGRLGNLGPWSAPVLWVALEYFRGSRPWGGFGWGELGYSQAPYPILLRSTTLAGVLGLTFLMVWCNACLEEAYARWRAGDRDLAPLRLPALVVGAAIAWGAIGTSGSKFPVLGKAALLQPSIDQAVKWSPENERATYSILGDLSREGAKTKPSLIVWPETAAPTYLLSDASVLQRVRGIVKGSGASHLVGCLHQEARASGPPGQYNAAVLLDPGGSSRGFYGKIHLVPFGEFVPFQEQLSFLGPVVGELGNFTRGPSHRSFEVEGFTFAPLICYEAVFPWDVRGASRTGAQVLVNISNDAWYGRTASAYQHALMAVAACATVRKSLLRSSNAGICLATDPDGRISGSTELYERRALGVEVKAAPGGSTFYERWGDWLPVGCWLGLLGLLVAAFRKGRHGTV